MFNELASEVDYEIDTRFTDDDSLTARYTKYASRDFDLIKDELSGVRTILEIGSGYGFLATVIKQAYPNIAYWHLEKNTSLQKLYASRGDGVLSHIDACISPDLIIMGHVLEHIREAPQFMAELLRTYPDSRLALFQTNPYGLIPRHLPWLWYGWSFDQHFYHFSIRSLEKLVEPLGLRLADIRYYQLHQEPSLSAKGLVKLALKIMNFFVSNEHMDAYMVLFGRSSQERNRI
jgi:hypothetical protein